MPALVFVSPADVWHDATEPFDYRLSHQDATGAFGRTLRIPVTLIATEQLALPPFMAEGADDALRAMQQELVDQVIAAAS